MALQEALDTVAPAPAGRPAPTLARLLARLEAGGAPALARVLAAGEPPAVPGAQERGGRELLADCVTAMVCCAAVDGAGGKPGLDWLDGPVLLLGGVRRGDLADPVVEAVEQGAVAELRNWLEAAGIRLEKPVRLG
jgi:hypothetical protein